MCFIAVISLMQESLFQAYTLQNQYGIPHSEVCFNNLIFCLCLSTANNLVVYYYYVLLCSLQCVILLLSQLAKLHQLSMQQSLSPIAQPASAVMPGMYRSNSHHCQKHQHFVLE